MKRSIISAVVLSAVFMSAGAFAAGEEGSLIINGEITGSSCYFDGGKDSETLQLKTVDASLFSNKAVGRRLKAMPQKQQI